MSKRSIAVLTLGLALQGPAALAQSEGWSTGYQMGTFYAHVSGADGTRLTFYCESATAPRANLVAGGLYLIVSLPKAQLDKIVSTIEIVGDDEAVSVPVSARPGDEEIELVWAPHREWGFVPMEGLVSRLREARRIELHAAGISISLPVEGAAEALADYPLRCNKRSS